MAAQFEVPALPSQTQPSDSSGSSDEYEFVQEEVKRRGKNYQYTVRHRFESKEQFEQWWNVEKQNWINQSSATNVNDMVETWFCRFASKYSNRRGYNCISRLRLRYPHHNNSVVVKRCENEHNHEAEANKAGLTEAQKTRARQLLEHGFTAKRIHIQFTEEMIEPLPELKTVQWFVSRLQKNNNSPFTDVELREYCETRSNVPESPDQPFVLAYEITSTELFYVVWTTPKLLERQLFFETVAGRRDELGRSEDTYVYSGVFAALVQRGYRPKYVLGDGAGSITLQPNVTSKKPCDGADANVDGSHAPSRSRLVAYFRKTWLESDLSKWSEGESPYCLNNNGAESVNLHIKNDHTIRKVQAFAVFLGKDVPTKPDIPLKVFKEAHKPQKECEDGKRVYCERTGQSEYIFSSTQVDLKTPQDVYREYERSFHQSPESWEEYLETRFSVCVVKPAVLGPFFACSCPSGSKKEHASTQLW